MVDRLKNKVAIVFGAGGSPGEWSNGKAAAVAYAREGAAVIAIDRLSDAAEETAQITRDEGEEVIGVTADMTNTEKVDRAVEDARARFGRLDILHNNVGIVQAGGPLETDDAAFQRSMDINLGSVHRTVHAVLPHFLAQGSAPSSTSRRCRPSAGAAIHTLLVTLHRRRVFAGRWRPLACPAGSERPRLCSRFVP